MFQIDRYLESDWRVIGFFGGFFMDHMNDKIDKWDHLLDPKNEEERSKLLRDDIEAESHKFIVETKAAIRKELIITAIEAQQQSDFFWDANQSARETGNKEEQSYFGTRVRIINNTLVAEWYQNRFVDDKSINNKKKTVFSTHIKKGKGSRYHRNHFKKAPGWAIEVINTVESRYELLRLRSNALSKLRRALNEYERLFDKCKNLE